MAKKNEEVVEETVETPLDPTEAVAKIDIIRGRMPVAVVAMIRFQEAETAVAACAAKYRTTVGKIDDIKKGRNFGYITPEFKPSAAQIADAKVYLEQLTGENATNTLAALENMGVAEDDGAAFEAARKAARKTKEPVAPADVAGEPTEAPVDEATEEDLSELTD